MGTCIPYGQGCNLNTDCCNFETLKGPAVCLHNSCQCRPKGTACWAHGECCEGGYGVSVSCTKPNEHADKQCTHSKYKTNFFRYMMLWPYVDCTSGTETFITSTTSNIGQCYAACLKKFNNDMSKCRILLYGRSGGIRSGQCWAETSCTDAVAHLGYDAYAVRSFGADITKWTIKYPKADCTGGTKTFLGYAYHILDCQYLCLAKANNDFNRCRIITLGPTSGGCYFESSCNSWAHNPGADVWEYSGPEFTVTLWDNQLQDISPPIPISDNIMDHYNDEWWMIGGISAATAAIITMLLMLSIGGFVCCVNKFRSKRKSRKYDALRVDEEEDDDEN